MNHRRRHYRPKQRRGVLLLVVLSMLVIFVLIAITFVLVASQEKDAAKAAGKRAVTGTDPKRLLDGAMYQLLRDTKDPGSKLKGESLLRDMYGDSGFTTALTKTVDATKDFEGDGQFLRLQLEPPSPAKWRGFYDGLTLTFLDGPARGMTTRILPYIENPDVTPTGLTVRIMSEDLHANLSVDQLPQNGDLVRVNGRPFTITTKDYTAGRIINESYDAPDVRNMFLGMVIPPSTASDRTQVIPSFDRTQTEPGVSTATRRVFGPVDPPWDPASNYYPWDVDNDGDGLPDSVWIDLGYPAQTTRDGRLHKPLFAFLCVDLDGRLNLNAHGNEWQVNTTKEPTGQGYGPPEIDLKGLFAEPPVPNKGYKALFMGTVTPDGRQIPGRYNAAARDGAGTRYIEQLAQRKFFDLQANYFATTNRLQTAFRNAGVGTSDLLLSGFSTPPDLTGELRIVRLNQIGRPVYDARPIRQANDSTIDIRQDTAYAMDLSRNGARGIGTQMVDATREQSVQDYPFSPAELERLLRAYDLDATSLPPRLWELVDAFREDLNSRAATNRRIVTTDSYDLPVFSVNMYELLEKLGVRSRWIKDAMLTPNSMLSPELGMGLRMDINRPFGDGRDRQAAFSSDVLGKYIVDEPGGTTTGGTSVAGDAWGTKDDPVDDPVNLNSNNQIDPKVDLYARQRFARQLYVLMMLLKDPKREIDFDGDGSRSPQETARGIAQWAINVVDFRDADSIMTPFAYDENVLDGWSVPEDVAGLPVGSKNVVWGCERPELLITETLAFHDRRTEDSNLDGDMDEFSVVHEPPGKDLDFDQLQRPRSGFFVELFNPYTPWTNNTTSGLTPDSQRVPPAEFYTYYKDKKNAKLTWSEGVVLDKLSGQLGGNGSPVWRMLVTEGTARDLDPDTETVNVLRAVYFTRPQNVGGDVPPSKQYYMDAATVPITGPLALKPGEYAVVGSAGEKNNNEYISVIAEDVTAGGTPDSSRRIVLLPAANLVRVDNNGSRSTNSALAVPIGRTKVKSRNLSISEPDGGYPSIPSPSPVDSLEYGTHPDFAVVHLQRLANPLLPWDARTNPYRTVDSMPVSLTVYNSVENLMLSTPPGREPRNPSGDWGKYDEFSTIQRGDRNDPTSTAFNLWTREPRGFKPSAANAIPGGGKKFNYSHVLKHSLGFLNEKYGNGPLPDQPFPWLAWNNRPFISQFELLQVPKSSSSQLTKEFSLPASANKQAPYGKSEHLFGHLLNFFQVSGANAAHLYRLFDYVHVPSRFVRAETMLNPKMFDVTTTTTTEKYPNQLWPFYFPMNAVSNYRDPGRININTIFSKDVWEALFAEHPGPTWEKFVSSRRGYGATGDILEKSTGVKSFFTKPFVAFDDLRYHDATGAAPPGAPRPDVQDTLLRSSSVGGTTSGEPLFAARTSYTSPPIDPRRNPYFYFEPLTRLGNLTTTRSNVYAVWITVGFFEVDPATGILKGAIDPATGIKNGEPQELGTDTGQITRHRGFYMIDRSIPVAFEPGVNHNVDKAVLLRRFIE